MTTGDLLKEARVEKRVKKVKEQIQEPSPQIHIVESEDFVPVEPAATVPERAAADAFPRLDDRYEVLSIIGKGGMGTVYKVFDKEIERTLAIKVLQSDLAAEDQTALRRFEQEAEAASQLEHHNLVSVFGYGKTKDGAPYLVMDYYDGESLSSVIKKESTLDSNRALNLFQQICEALAHAHEKGVVHRDIKPGNVIVSQSESGIETARIVDFGIAKILPVSNRETHNLTETRQVFGSPHYMSPEHCLGFKMDERSDIYSLGCLMYEVLTGDPPFNVNDAIQAVIKHINEEAKPFSCDMNDDPVKRKLEGVVLKCLEKQQEDRYQSVNEVLADLQLIQEGKAPSKFVRRRAAKLEYTAGQIFRAIVGTLLLIIFIGYQLLWFGSFDSGNQIFAILMLGLTAGGSALFCAASGEQYSHLSSGKTSKSDWWNLFVILSISLMCLSFFPKAIEMFIEAFNTRAYLHMLDWLPELVSGFSLLHLTAIGSVFVSLLGRIFLCGSKKTKGYWIGLQFAGLYVVSMLLAVSFFPVQSSAFIRMLGNADVIEKRAPQSSERLIEVALQLDPLNQQALFDLVDRKPLADAEKLFEEYFMNEKRSKPLAVAHFRKSQLYSEQSWVTMQEVSKAIKFMPNDKYYVHRAWLHYQRGDYGDAMKDYEEAQRSNPDNPDSYIGKARIFAATGNFQIALHELNGIAAQKSGWTNMNVFFLRALLIDKLNNHELALRDYATVAELAKNAGDLPAREALMAAYSSKQIGDDDNHLKYLEMSDSEQTDLRVLESEYRRMRLPLRWRNH